MEKKSVLICAIVLLFYYAFTSGLIYEIEGSDVISSIETPYSIGLSAERTGVAGVFNQDDVKCAQWLVDNKNPEYKFIADYNGIRFLFFHPEFYRDQVELISSNLSVNKGYIFLTTWNVEKGKYIIGASTGTRLSYDLPVYHLPVVFQSGKSVIYGNRLDK